MRFSITVLMICAFCCTGTSGCKGMLAPEQNPTRVIIYFLKEIGRVDFESASEWVAPESQDQIETWAGDLFFPEVEDPPTSDDGGKIDRFIGHMYRVTIVDEGETETTARLVFAATDAIASYPSLVDAPLPNSALYMVTLVKALVGEGEDAELGEWRIFSMIPTTERV